MAHAQIPTVMGIMARPTFVPTGISSLWSRVGTAVAVEISTAGEEEARVSQVCVGMPATLSVGEDVVIAGVE